MVGKNGGILFRNAGEGRLYAFFRVTGERGVGVGEGVGNVAQSLFLANSA